MYGYGSQPSTIQHYPQGPIHAHPGYAPIEHPLHVDDQERRKLERKRLRNRMAASKCRQKKLERIADLEQQVNEEKLRSANLDRDIQALRACLEELQKMANYHQQKGCPTHYHRPNVKLVNGH